MATPEPESIDQLIDDCADIPARLCTTHTELPVPRVAAPWSVTDSEAAQLSELDAFG